MNNTIKNKLNNTKINFSKNLILSIIVPCTVIVFALILGLVAGFNKGMDFNGGITLSVVTEANLSDSKIYTETKNKVDTVLKDSGLNATTYLLEKDSYSDAFVVKINYSGKNADALVTEIKANLKTAFYDTLTNEEVELRNLISVSTFGSSIDSWFIMSSILSTFVAVLVICAYIICRAGLYTSMLAFLSSIISNILAWALVVVSRVQVNKETLTIMPIVAIVAAVSTFLFAKKAKTLLFSTDKYQTKTNYELSNDTAKQSLYTNLLFVTISVLVCLVFAILNISSPVLFMGLAIAEAVVAVCYTNLFILPAIWGLTYVRKPKKAKAKKENKPQEKLNEEVLKETDLDNLVSN